jgi:hypothetical protein
MANNRTFILSDESVNTYGFWVSTKGIDLGQFEKNPVMLWGHHRTWRGTDDEVLPIGHWENIRKVGGQLLAEPVFDEKDPFAKRISEKVSGGFLKAASIGMTVIETSADTQHLKPGQTLETVTKCRIREASIVDIGANSNALVLYDQNGAALNLSAGGQDSKIPGIKEVQKDKNSIISTNNNNSNMQELIALALGLPKEATEAEIVKRVGELKAETDTATAESARLSGELTALRDGQITALTDAAITARKITADKKDHFLTLGKTAGVEALRATLDCIQVERKPLDFLKPTTPGGSAKKFSELTAEERVSLRETDLVEYKRLYREEYGVVF